MQIKLKYIVILYFILFISASCKKQDSYSIPGKTLEKDSVPYFKLTEGQRNVLKGSKICLMDKFKYDLSMKYQILSFENGVNSGSAVYPNGDLDPALGVCTDLIIRALRYGNVCDLQEKIHEDILSDWNSYPMKRWNAKKPDANIDHRRVPNLIVWFGKYWQSISDDDYQPGDIIAWDMDDDSWGDHIGIVSDKFENNTPYLIHNFPNPGYVAEEKVLNNWKIIGHFRIND
jgi:uncharacterized protein